MLTKYRASINPPYSKKDLPIILGTIILVVGLTFAVSTLVNPTANQDLRGRAEKSDSDKNIIIGEPVTTSFSPLVQITRPTSDTTITQPFIVEVNIDPSLKPESVSFWKDQDKKPFLIDYENPYEAVLDGLHPGRHTLNIQVTEKSGNSLLSQERVFFIK